MVYAVAHIRGGGEMGRAWYQIHGAPWRPSATALLRRSHSPAATLSASISPTSPPTVSHSRATVATVPLLLPGKYLNKKNTFTDFCDVAEHLTKTGWTAPDRLACIGRSAGGLLMGATLNLRPDLFRCCIAVRTEHGS